MRQLSSFTLDSSAVFNCSTNYTRKNAQVVTNLQQTCVAMLSQQLMNRMYSHCLFPAC
jgi:hypothetical protein